MSIAERLNASRLDSSVEDAANEWYIKLIRAVDIDELWPDFTHWLQSDPAHRRAFRAVEVFWALIALAGSASQYQDAPERSAEGKF
jgi:ferric-dicitrate binding protein FerR (iron transport regulator)